MGEKEIRHIPLTEMEIRADKEAGKMIVEGYAIVYNRETELWPGMTEIIMPGAATKALNGDQYYLWQHDIKSPLARKSIGTLTAKEDEKGVFIRAELINNQFGKDCFEAIKTRLVDSQSFAFTVEREEWEENIVDGKRQGKRIVLEFKTLLEFSAVTFPAYEDTNLKALATRNRPEQLSEGLRQAMENSVKLIEKREEQKELWMK